MNSAVTKPTRRGAGGWGRGCRGEQNERLLSRRAGVLVGAGPSVPCRAGRSKYGARVGSEHHLGRTSSRGCLSWSLSWAGSRLGH